MAGPSFSVSGLASGMDSRSIIDKLVELESRPLALLQRRQAAFQAQISILGTLTTRFGELDAAAEKLGTGGVLGVQVTSANTAFSAVGGSAAVAGSYEVQVTQLASAAKWRSGPISSGAALQPGTLTLTVDGVVYPPADDPDHPPITVGATTSLAQVAEAIRRSGAPVSASVLDDGTRQYLSITALETGYQDAPAIGVEFTPDEPLGPGADLRTDAYEQVAKNATLEVDGLTFTRTSNTISDAIPGTTLTLKAQGGPRETLTIANDVNATQARLRTFVDAYNGLMTVVKQQLSVSKDTSRASTLAGDATVRGLQQALQSLGSSAVEGLGTVRSLADVGVRTERDGTLGIDATVLAAAVARDPTAVNAIFARAPSGIAARVADLADLYGQSTSGLLALRETGLRKQIRTLDDQAVAMQARIEAFRTRLAAQYAAMENVVGQLKSIGNFLTMQENAKNA